MKSQTNFKKEKGLALLMVLWITTLLAVIVGEFCYAMKIEINITRNFKESTQGYYIALAGVNRAAAELIKETTGMQKLQTPVEEANDDDADENLIEWRVGANIPPVLFGEGEYKVKISNESGKININKATRSMLRMLLEGFDLDESEKDTIADSIMDWRDKDDLHRINGAEDDYYQSLDDSYECKDDDFDAIEELLLVKGVTADIFYGGLESMVTIYTQTNNININAASWEMLLALPGMTETAAREIITFRGEKEIKRVSVLNDIIDPDIYQSIKPYISLKISPFYSIDSFGGINGSKVKEGLRVLIKIDPKEKKGFRITRWIDFIIDPVIKREG
ncbi:MAG: general secretion pathway protein GspK [Deltaproteobacteria bacterium]|nr:general secretion pathway protein GspK [Deltaproteobacteria bacterium]